MGLDYMAYRVKPVSVLSSNDWRDYMATAEDLRAEFTAFMREKGIKYSIHDEADNIVRLQFGGRSFKDGGGADTDIFVDFDENDDEARMVHFAAFEFASCTEENYAQVLVKLNEYNRRYRWVKFWMKKTDNGGVLTADEDEMLIPGQSADEVTHTAFRMSDIVEDVILDLGDLVVTDGNSPSMDEILALLKMLADQK